MENEIRIRAFRAIDDQQTCLKFIEGHRKVLEIYGIGNVTTNTEKWMYNRSVFVIAVESLDKTKIYGGARIHCADGKTPLPIEDATGKLDSKVYQVIKHYSQYGACELCGLWNSLEVAGLGIGSFLPAIVAVTVTNQIGLNILFALCSPFTTRFKDWIGGQILTTVGDNGIFYYPKFDLKATVLFADSIYDMSRTAPRVRDKMLYLRENPSCMIIEKSPFKNQYVKVFYETKIESANINEFKTT